MPKGQFTYLTGFPLKNFLLSNKSQVIQKYENSMREKHIISYAYQTSNNLIWPNTKIHRMPSISVEKPRKTEPYSNSIQYKINGSMRE